jgi:hypothetical protein
MVVRLSALRTRRTLLPGNIIYFLFNDEKHNSTLKPNATVTDQSLPIFRQIIDLLNWEYEETATNNTPINAILE